MMIADGSSGNTNRNSLCCTSDSAPAPQRTCRLSAIRGSWRWRKLAAAPSTKKGKKDRRRTGRAEEKYLYEERRGRGQQEKKKKSNKRNNKR